MPLPLKNLPQKKSLKLDGLKLTRIGSNASIMSVKRDDERDIKVALVEYLLVESATRNILASEAPYFFGKRRADLLDIGEHIHAYEIKGKYDRLDKLPDQIASYIKSFDYLTIVTSRNHLDRITDIAPKKVGILEFHEGRFKKRRTSTRIKRKCKAALASVLSRSEVIAALNENCPGLTQNKAALVNELRDIAASTLTESVLQAHFIDHYRSRYRESFKLFMSDKGRKVHVDDLRTLACEVYRLR
jgi:hypothetical protein